MLEIILISIVILAIVCGYEWRLQRAERTVDALEKWAVQTCEVLESYNRTLSMHNDTLEITGKEIDDCQKILASFPKVMYLNKEVLQ
jgi:hypothetical protein